MTGTAGRYSPHSLEVKAGLGPALRRMGHWPIPNISCEFDMQTMKIESWRFDFHGRVFP